MNWKVGLASCKSGNDGLLCQSVCIYGPLVIKNLNHNLPCCLPIQVLFMSNVASFLKDGSSCENGARGK